MPAVPNPLSALGAATFAAKAVKAFRARDEIRALFTLVDSDVRGSDLLPFGTASGVLRRLHGVLVQPEVEHALIKWLDEGDDRERGPLTSRLAELLVFEEQGIDSQKLADLVVHSIEANLPRAKRNDREALILEGQRTRGEIKQLQEQLADVASSVGPAMPVNARSLRIAQAVYELAPSQADIVQKLIAADPEGAVPLQEALEAGGVTRLAEAIDGSRPWLENASAEVWEAVGRLVESIGRMGQAQHAYERAADHPAAGDRVRQLVRASNAAAEQGNTTRERELLDAARSEAPENPALLLREAHDAGDPDQELELLDQITPVDDAQAAAVGIARIEALLTKHDFKLARDALEGVRDLQPDTRTADEIAASITLTEAQFGSPDERVVSPEHLVSAAHTFVRLTEDMRVQERWDAVAILTGRAILSFALADNSREASRLLDETLADEHLLGSIEARRLLVTAALLLQRVDDALALVPEGDDENDRLDRAAAHVMSGDPTRSAGVVDELREIMGGSGEGSPRAAYLLLCASTNNAEVGWDAEAERIIAEAQPDTAVMLKAFRLATEDDLEGAENYLRPHTNNPSVLRYLIHLAGRREEDAKALRLARTLVQRTGMAADRLSLAAALARNGEQGTAVDQLLALARDQRASFDERSKAFARAARLTQEAERFADLDTLGREWAQFDDSDDPRWMTILAQVMRFRHAEALDTWKEFGEPEANSTGRARLLGEVFALAAEPLRALQMLAELSDDFGRPEELEVALILAAIRLTATTPELPPDLLARIGESFSTFPERFPNSTALRTIPVDPANPAESLLAAFGEQLKQRAETGEQLAAGIRGGVTAVPMLAAAMGRSIGEALFLLKALPISFPDDQFEQFDRADAAAAYHAGGAVWDASSIFVVASLGTALEQTLRHALPASSVARATQQDTAQDLNMPGTADRGEITVVEGLLAFGRWSESDRDANHRRAKEMLRLATDLPSLSLSSATADDELITIGNNPDAPTAIRSWACTLALARQEDLAVFSDDRVVRQSARELGLKTFGTLALLEVLAAADVIQASERNAVRKRVISHGAWGARHSVDELVCMAREANWQPTDGLRAALGDTTAWLSFRARWAERIVGFLDAVTREAPEQMDKWVHRAIDAVTHDVGGDYQGHATVFLLVAINPLLDPPRMTDRGFRGLIRSIRRMRYFQILKPPRDLLVVAVGELLTTTDDPTLQALLLRRVLDRVEAEDQELLRKHFVR